MSTGPNFAPPDELKVDPFGVLVGHTWAEVGVILEAINGYGIKKFVEIGVHKGGLAALLAHSTTHIPGFKYLGIEIDESVVAPTVRKLFHPVVTGTGERDLWFMDAHAEETVDKVAHWAKTIAPGPTLFYCDGGSKPTEFALYAPVMQSGDFIAAHDYDYGGYDRAEISASDVKPVAQMCDLVPLGFFKPYRIIMMKKVSP